MQPAWRRPSHAAPQFRARLGFLPEVDLRGLTYNVGYDKVIPRGAFAEASIGLATFDWTHIDGSQYRRHYEVDSLLALRNRCQILANYYQERFEGQDDHLQQTGLTYPRDDPYRNVSVEYDTGRLALVPYTSITTAATYRFGRRLQASVRYQQVRHGDYEDQLIFTGSFDLLHDRAVSGRIVKANADLNGYVSLRQSGNRGVEYFLIVGDPNALRFRPSAIVKVVVPFEVLLSHARG